MGWVRPTRPKGQGSGRNLILRRATTAIPQAARARPATARAARSCRPEAQCPQTTAPSSDLKRLYLATTLAVVRARGQR